MRVWILQGTYEGEMFASVHLTEKGAALAAIADVLETLGVEDEESALAVMNARYAYTDTDGKQTEAIEWDQDKMRGMPRNELWGIFGEWGELTWDHPQGYQIDVIERTMQA